MNLETAKRTVLEAGHRLLAEGLVSRTWGNISHRVDETTFVITPSGRNYEALTEDDIVEVRFSDLSHKGAVKPSSEKGMHAAIYMDRPEISAIIHTHQSQASAVAAARRDVEVHEDALAEVIGTPVRVAAYALPGTKKLARATMNAIQGRKATLLANHGATCIGEDMEEAFAVSRTLETACRKFVLENARMKNGAEAKDLAALYADYAKIDTFGTPDVLESLVDSLRPDFPAGTVFLPSRTPAILACAAAGHTVPPLLDDMAQIVGVNARVADAESPSGIRRKLKRRNAVLLNGVGALCMARTKEDAEAVSQVLEKNCKAVIESRYLGGGHPIHLFESWLMRIVYQLKYSRASRENTA